MESKKLPPGQHEIGAIPRWNIDHLGIIPENPKFDPEKWTLTVNGEVEKPVELTWRDFLKLPSVESISNFHCVEGWSVRDCRWYGVKFSTLVKIVVPSKDAKYVLFRCSDGYTTPLDLKDLLKDNILLAYKLNGQFLEEPLGGPVRLVVPDKYAYKSAMWIERITFTNRKKPGYWEERGYSDTADVWKNDRVARKKDSL
ncbi:MAG: molybdopterin-dependent oxidoreductase [Candidatus Bathyarchaeota archaeon]|nr:molybdopterin-dependent oxidoreductase [Candidatus Bathyarchaeota archaeon]